MSRIIQQAKTQYRNAILIEIVIMLVSACFFAFWQIKSALDFLLGFFSALLPFSAFIYVVFYLKQQLTTKLTALYRGEAIKFVLTIILISISFRYLEVTKFLPFFSGFFMALMLNNFIPFLLRRI
ncbi:ATP synthase subunit I [Haemophilus haemolyticus]|uniref:ATP F0F1 synthase subunit I n=1 Tax=Haemophilus haemolyticus TaxID=726 RepID=A0A502JPT8_HAEHA|nr:ATP synthase subunit I [Haemophilus haemolyticus]NYA25647.1 ATP synthase subunit I [Haemophilus haemolyticus]TPG98516.1 ATP F0F1 synthase subunit I [Haemophilus haemolyticus]